jgi:hypothetical protein
VRGEPVVAELASGLGRAPVPRAESAPLTVRAHLTCEWQIKLGLGALLTAAFWVAYLWLERSPLFPVARVAPSGLDALVPFMPRLSYVYASLTLFIPVAPWLMISRPDLLRYSAAVTAIMLIGFAAFFFWPTACARPAVEPGLDPLYLWIRRIDRDLNALPSLHGAYAVFSALCCHRVLRSIGDRGGARLFTWAWALAILFATLATKQHVALDLLAGGVLGAAGYGLFLLLTRAASRRGAQTAT